MIPAGTIIEEISQDLGDPDITIDIGDVAAASSLNPSDSRLDANKNRNTMAFLIDGGDVFADSFDANGVDGPASDQSHPLFPELDEVNEDQGIPAHSVHSEAEHDLSRTSTHDLYADSPMSLGSSRRQQEGSGSSSMAPSVRRVVPQLPRTEETPLLQKISNISSEVRTLVPLMLTLTDRTLTCVLLARGHYKRRFRLHELVCWKTVERVRCGLLLVLLSLFRLFNDSYDS
jgi:hypothetical protein